MPEQDGYELYEDDEFEEDEVDLGPDERDLDLLDGSWEEEYYAGRLRTRDWSSIGAGVALLALIGLLVPMILVLVN